MGVRQATLCAEIVYCKADVHDHTCKVKSTSPDDMSTSISYLAQKLRLSMNSDPMDPLFTRVRSGVRTGQSVDDRPDHFAGDIGQIISPVCKLTARLLPWMSSATVLVNAVFRHQSCIKQLIETIGGTNTHRYG
jgi:hypothetical protein